MERPAVGTEMEMGGDGVSVDTAERETHARNSSNGKYERRAMGGCGPGTPGTTSACSAGARLPARGHGGGREASGKVLRLTGGLH